MICAGKNDMIFDTDVMIWAMRGNEKALKLLEETLDRSLSVVTYMELLKGASNKFYASEIHRIIKKHQFEIIQVSEKISHRALFYIEEYGFCSGMGVADAMIAATAAENNLPLCTANYKDFRQIKDLEVKVFKVS
jgi:predicted nucleic acid-binding protein